MAQHDDVKRQHDLKVWLTDREFLDLCRIAVDEDRKPGEMGRVMLRRYMYGKIGVNDVDINRAISADKGRDPV